MYFASREQGAKGAIVSGNYDVEADIERLANISAALMKQPAAAP
jgi:hypothetical protein